MYNDYGYYYEDAVQNLASDMLDKIAEEIEYEDGMERIASKNGSFYGKWEDFMGEKGSGKADFKGASAGIGKKVSGASPQRKVRLSKNGKRLLKGATGVGAIGLAGLGISHVARRRLNANGQEKAAAYFEEAEIYKEAAEEAYDEALAMEEAALNLYDYFEELY